MSKYIEFASDQEISRLTIRKIINANHLKNFGSLNELNFNKELPLLQENLTNGRILIWHFKWIITLFNNDIDYKKYKFNCFETRNKYRWIIGKLNELHLVI